MPTYTVTALEECLDNSKRARIAAEITRIHNATTGAPTYFAQVIFQELKAGRYFVGGMPLHGQQVFVHGQIRAGRTAESKHKLLTQILESVATASGLQKNNVWIYIVDLPATQMAEFGHVLPEPGAEETWADNLPEADRARMQSFAIDAA
jgi:phenylpyruvate tautomerase PptA (4-oxalocrotonate tautomerase family)